VAFGQEVEAYANGDDYDTVGLERGLDAIACCRS
jgi:hypothetical protein